MTNKRIIVRYKTKEVIGVASTQDTAHTLAETISYIDNGNSTYGLFGIQLIDHTELCNTEEGRLAWNSFIRGI
jgi:hypothetical protein